MMLVGDVVSRILTVVCEDMNDKTVTAGLKKCSIPISLSIFCLPFVFVFVVIVAEQNLTCEMHRFHYGLMSLRTCIQLCTSHS